MRELIAKLYKTIRFFPYDRESSCSEICRFMRSVRIVCIDSCHKIHCGLTNQKKKARQIERHTKKQRCDKKEIQTWHFQPTTSTTHTHMIRYITNIHTLSLITKISRVLRNTQLHNSKKKAEGKKRSSSLTCIESRAVFTTSETGMSGADCRTKQTLS